MLLQCLPHGICSWDYRIMRNGSRIGATQIHRLSETGSTDVEGEQYNVLKEGALKSGWSLAHEGTIVAEARKPDILFRRILIADSKNSYILQAQRMLVRPFELLEDGNRLLSITPDHSLTRRGTIRGEASTPLEIATFSFWLVVVMWRRASNASGAGGGAGGGGGGG